MEEQKDQKTMDEEYRLKHLVDDLVFKAILFWKPKGGKPGEFIKKLKKEDRELLKNVNSNHFNHRIR